MQAAIRIIQMPRAEPTFRRLEPMSARTALLAFPRRLAQPRRTLAVGHTRGGVGGS